MFPWRSELGGADRINKKLTLGPVRARLSPKLLEKEHGKMTISALNDTLLVLALAILDIWCILAWLEVVDEC